ncbi:hypothetical protein [Gloeobacter kilaueensis]|uniref:Uncharacterized protein n=1 Tax=Gloeobacter kilaueensis (strain ATCC BAA-2537 / CCAP 1431/1 / ULC 316 / JS1) TaxID=1183438 RepID=U5QG06_GLOK1|nr:hypothetical protein [Gloeobacter kilaueensis]AGY56574.1 hypothetical protein GKIL_0327 [Gloeobacter kilaueensis JS1]
MQALPRTSTTEMEVTSIRLERELKEKLKQFSGDQGYQALVREILWNYVREKSGDYHIRISAADIRTTIVATAHQDQRCALTGNNIRTNESILLGLTQHGNLVPLKTSSLSSPLA